MVSETCSNCQSGRVSGNDWTQPTTPCQKCAVAPEVSIKTETTARGFAIATFTDRYGNECSLQKSSLATEDAIWLGVSDPPIRRFTPGRGWDDVEVPCPPGGSINIPSRMHLTQDMVRDLLPMLQRFVDTGEIVPQ